MTELLLSSDHTAAIRAHAERAYPAECCGFLLGKSLWQVSHVLPATNARGEEEQHNRFYISPEASVRADKEARRLGLEIIGHYHSHPEHPAIPSTPSTVSASATGATGQSDLENATWPGYAFLIVSVMDGKAGEMLCWDLAEDRSKFLPVSITIEGSI